MRMASTAAPSAAFLSPLPSQRPAASAAASVTRTSSMARLRSGAWVCGSMRGSVALARAWRDSVSWTVTVRGGPAAVGFMPDDEGLALHDAGLEAAARRAVARDRHVLRQVGHLPRRRGARGRHRRVHRRPPPRVGGEPGRLGAPRRAARRPPHRPHGHAAVLPPHDRGRRARGRRGRGHRRSSPTVAAHWATPLGLVFVDGGHAFDVALADYEGWARYVAPGGLLVFHDVFEDPADGGQAPLRGVAARRRRRLHPGLDHRQPPRPAPPLTVAALRPVGE